MEFFESIYPFFCLLNVLLTWTVHNWFHRKVLLYIFTLCWSIPTELRLLFHTCMMTILTIQVYWIKTYFIIIKYFCCFDYTYITENYYYLPKRDHIAVIIMDQKIVVLHYQGLLPDNKVSPSRHIWLLPVVCYHGFRINYPYPFCG